MIAALIMSPLHLLLALVSLSSLAMGEALAETTQKIGKNSSNHRKPD